MMHRLHKNVGAVHQLSIWSCPLARPSRAIPGEFRHFQTFNWWPEDCLRSWRSLYWIGLHWRSRTLSSFALSAPSPGSAPSAPGTDP
jgi:hypothetical protein